MTIDYGYDKISIVNFLKAVKDRKLSPRHINDVIRWCKNKDITKIEMLLKSKNNWTRKCAVEVISKIGNKKLIIEAAKVEEDKSVLYEMLKSLMNC